MSAIAHPISLICSDHVSLHGHLWSPDQPAKALVIINPATGVRARYYHYYAQFLAQNGYLALTYDYRGIGLSRPHRLRGTKVQWRHWGELDFDGALTYAATHHPGLPIMVVGHSIGGFLPGYSPQAHRITRMLTMGAQYAYWRDYAAHVRKKLFLKWHVVMPLLSGALGYFPGKRLGWLEDLPKGVAQDWSFRSPRMEEDYPPAQRPEILSRFAAVTAPILAIGLSDDELGTAPALERALSYYSGAPKTLCLLSPKDFGETNVGHFALFHTRHKDSFWIKTLAWLEKEENPWGDKAVSSNPE